MTGRLQLSRRCQSTRSRTNHQHALRYGYSTAPLSLARRLLLLLLLLLFSIGLVVCVRCVAGAARRVCGGVQSVVDVSEVLEESEYAPGVSPSRAVELLCGECECELSSAVGVPGVQYGVADVAVGVLVGRVLRQMAQLEVVHGARIEVAEAGGVHPLSRQPTGAAIGLRPARRLSSSDCDEAGDEREEPEDNEDEWEAPPSLS